MRHKSLVWQSLEAGTKLRDLTHHLELSLLRQEEPKLPASGVKTAMALATLVGLIGLAGWLAIGRGWMWFYFSLGLYPWQTFIGLSVASGLTLALWTLRRLFSRR